MNNLLFAPVSYNSMVAEMQAYERHIKGDYDYTIMIDPMATPRPRSRITSTRAGKPCAPYVLVYNERHYMDYKDSIKILLRDARLKLKPGDYSMLFVTFFVPYSSWVPLKNKIEGAKHRKKPDYDNFIKGFQDALEQSGIIAGDGQLADGAVRKRYTNGPGHISFNLL